MAVVDVYEALSWTSLTGVHIATCAASVMALVDVSEALPRTGMTEIQCNTYSKRYGPRELLKLCPGQV